MKDISIGIIGLGYVGLPLFLEFSKQYPVVGFDTSAKRIEELRNGHDHTLEADEKSLQRVNTSTDSRFSTSIEDIAHCNIYIVTVPTPIDSHRQPNLQPLLKASETVGKVLNKNDIVIYESTVYPGATEDDCVPVLEKHSGLKFNHDFFCGYSPERINPGDKKHRLTSIMKVTSGSTPEIAEKVNSLYKSIISAGTHLAPSIKVAEAAKVIENTQRDINIAFINELAMIFNQMGIKTKEVLEAAETKWNFIPFKPGLVGGHCIGVDPYYLTHKAESIGYHPEMILAGRRLNDNMGIYVANQVVKLMIHKSLKVQGSRILVLGIAFKENCPDIRNSRVIDVIHELQEFGCKVEVYDPWADASEVKQEYGLDLLQANETPDLDNYEALVLAVSHDVFLEMGIKCKPRQVVYDIKSVLDESDGTL